MEEKRLSKQNKNSNNNKKQKQAKAFYTSSID